MSVSPPTKRILIVAGEASGDLHGARLLEELRLELPDLTAYGLGGDELVAQGLDVVADVSTISVMGLAEVARVYRKARKIFDQVVERVKSEPPDLAVLIDFPEFNLRLAPVLKKLGVKVVYYVSPQVWAWRKRRVHSMARCIDRMLVFFPFEVDFYRGRVDVVHVGHPLVDEVPELDQAWDTGNDEPPCVALLPGSRRSEVSRLLPVQLEAVRQLREKTPDLRAVLIEAPTLDPRQTDELIAASGVEVEKIPGRSRFAAIAASHLALCASGTATLEVGLLRTPMVVVYRIGLVGYWLGRIVVSVPFISLVNLVLGRPVVPELIQGRATSTGIAHEASRILHEPARREEIRAGLGGLRGALGESGASRRAALEVLKFLQGSAS